MTSSKSSESGYMDFCVVCFAILFGVIFLVSTLMYLSRGKGRKDMYIMASGEKRVVGYYIIGG